MNELDTNRKLLHDVIAACWQELMDVEYKNLKPYLHKEDILTRGQLSSLDVDQKDDLKKNYELFYDYAITLSIDSFKKLIRAVNAINPDVAKKLEDQLQVQEKFKNQKTSITSFSTNSNIPSSDSLNRDCTSSVAEGFPELQNVFGLGIRLTGKECGDDVRKACELMSQSTSNNTETTEPKRVFQMETESASPKDNGTYDMNTTPRGIAFIINNNHFDYLKNREGSNQDRNNLRDMFQKLGWHVTTKDNLTTEEMETYLKKLCTNERLKSTSALAIAILTHGTDNDVLFGRDGEIKGNTRPVPGTYINRFDLMHIFSSSNCIGMKGKPKLFIIQACRGREEDQVITSSRDSKHLERMESDIPHEKLKNPTPKMISNRVPETGDMCTIFSSSIGYKAYRMRKTGSPFIQMLAETVEELASTTELPKIMQRVNRKFYEEQLPEGKLTLPEFSSQLVKDWYLNPPSESTI